MASEIYSHFCNASQIVYFFLLNMLLFYIVSKFCKAKLTIVIRARKINDPHCKVEILLTIVCQLIGVELKLSPGLYPE